MAQWSQVVYTYDGSFAGFLSCVFDSYVYKEEPVEFAVTEEQSFLWPERVVETDEEHARRVYRSLGEKVSGAARQLVSRGFLTCLPRKEVHLWQFIRLGYEKGRRAAGNLADERVRVLDKAVYQLEHEAHMYKGFVRFSEQEGVLVAEIEPKNRVLSLMRPHFCDRFSGENFLIYDRTHGEALFHQAGRSAIVPVESLKLGAPSRKELDCRRMWRRFYNAIAIRERENPKCQMTNMPKRYWAMMTEFQTEEALGPGTRQVERND